jgi:hypothetical protein
MEDEGSVIRHLGTEIVEFDKGYDSKSLLTRRRKARLYPGIDWGRQKIRDWSGRWIELWFFKADDEISYKEVLKIVREQYSMLKRPPKELGLCLLKRFPKRIWDPPWVLLHTPISHPKKEFPHVSVLSGSRLGGSRKGTGKPFGEGCYFVFYRVIKK